jgi:cytochrome c peroxidase
MAKRIFIILWLTLTAFSCTQQKQPEISAIPIGSIIKIASPTGLPEVNFPPENPTTAEAIALGRKLFYDPQLSSDNTVSCSSCHNPALYFSDGLPVAKGVNAQLATRNSPSILNANFNSLQFLDGRSATLELQAGEPIANPKEMNLPHEICVTKLNSIPSYQAEFKQVFGDEKISMQRIVNAIASFERTLLSGNSAFDKNTMNDSAKRGMSVFTNKDKGNCASCHVAPLFTDGKFHNLGAGMDASGELKDLGRFNQTKNETDRGAFRTPSLRNIAKTAPYMHDGSLKSLKEVIDFYIGGGSSNPQLDKEIKPLILSAQEREDLLAFLESLTGEIPANVGAPERK